MMPAKAECELADAFVAARYWLPTPQDGWILTFARQPPRTDLAAPTLPRGAWAIISAANPWSINLGETENAARNRQLAADLAASGALSRPMRNSAAEGTWGEASYLVEGLSREEVMKLGRRFDQSAAVFGIAARCGLLWMRTERWVVLPGVLISAHG